MSHNAREFVNNLPPKLVASVILNSNDPTLENDDDLVSLIEQKPDMFSDIIKKHNRLLYNTLFINKKENS